MGSRVGALEVTRKHNNSCIFGLLPVEVLSDRSLAPALQSRTLLSSRMWSLLVLLESELVRHEAATVFWGRAGWSQMSSKCSTASRFAGKQDPYAVLTLGDQNHRSKTITGK